MKERSDQGLHCLLFHLRLLETIFYGETTLFIFYLNLQQIFLVSKVDCPNCFGIMTVPVHMHLLLYFQGRSKNQRNFWDIWGSEDTEAAAATTDDLFLEVRKANGEKF